SPRCGPMDSVSGTALSATTLVVISRSVIIPTSRSPGHRDRTDVLLSHQSCGLDDRRRGADRAGVCRHRVANALGHLASSPRPCAILSPVALLGYAGPQLLTLR